MARDLVWFPPTNGEVDKWKVDDPGPVPGTWVNGVCPRCDEIVYSDSPTNAEGMRFHITMRHPDLADGLGITTRDPAKPGWVEVH